MSLYTNLAAYYKLDETSGTRYDSTANGKDLNVVGGSVGYHTGVYGNAAYFDKTLGKYLKINSAIGSGANISYSFWIKPLSNPPSDNYRQHVQHYLDGYLYVSIEQGNGNTVAVAIGASRNVTTATMTGSAWNHVVVTIEGSTVKVYIAADLKNTWTMTPNDPDVNSFTIGTGGTAVPDSDIDEFAIYSRVLDQTEVTRLYNSGTGWTYPLPVDYSTDATAQSYTLSWLDVVVRKIKWNQPSKNTTTFTHPSKK